MKRITPILAFAAGLLLHASANALTINFDNTEVPGIGNLTPVTTQWNSFGLDITNAYYYVDSRDPFDQMGLSVFPVSSRNIARIDLIGATTNSMTIDWWTIGSDIIYVDVYDSGDNLLDSFNGNGDGTTTLNGADISYLTWHDSGGFVQISTLTFDAAASAVPEPGSLALIGIGLVGLVAARKRKKV